MENRDTSSNDIVEKYYDDIYKYCLAKLNGDSAAAEDAAGDVMAAAMRNAKKLSSHPDPKGWLYKAARFCVKSIRRQQKRYRRRFILLDPADFDPERFGKSVFGVSRRKGLASTSASYDGLPEGRELTDEEIEALKAKLLQELPPEERELILSRYEKGESLEELAKRYGISKDAMRMRIKRVSVKLRDRIKIYFQNDRSF